MKKVGILTFHWATNFGAVLQAYALQKCLEKMGFDAEVINYRPYRIILIQKITMWRNYEHQRKERALRRFRKKIKLSNQTVHTAKELKFVFEQYDSIIAGSDQIWNESFTLGAEGKVTLSYFLQNCPSHIKRISYAASFGAEKVSELYKEQVKPELSQFSAISVREKTGMNIVRWIGLEAEEVCDPTLLLTKEDYWKLTKDIQLDVPSVFSYILHKHQETIKIAEYVKKMLGDNIGVSECSGLEEWLYAIQHSEIVVTNSFHGVMLSIILNKPFIAVLIKGSGMNDRLSTILAEVGLENRAVDSYDENLIDAILRSPIAWNHVNNRLEALRNHGRSFLNHSLL